MKRDSFVLDLRAHTLEHQELHHLIDIRLPPFLLRLSYISATMRGSISAGLSPSCDLEVFVRLNLCGS
jgi:hypothetical protein